MDPSLSQSKHQVLRGALMKLSPLSPHSAYKVYPTSDHFSRQVNLPSALAGGTLWELPEDQQQFLESKSLK